MGTLKLFRVSFRLTMGKLCRQIPLLAGLSLLCAGLPLLGGQAAEELLSRGVEFSGITLAVTAPEGDDTPRLLERYMGGMEDISGYCRVEAMGREEALAALEDGRVSAVLALPEDFIQGVRQGTNPAVQLIVDSGRPLESLLTLWVGQSAADMLSAAQAGVYGVLDLYDQGLTGGQPWDQVMMEINLRYIQWILGRQEVVGQRTVLPTGSLPIGQHYTLSLFFWLLLSLGPLFAWNYQGRWLDGCRRLRWVGRSPLTGLAASVAASWAVLAVLIWAALWLVLGARPLGALPAALCCGLFAAVYAALCALATGTAAGCAGLSFLISFAALLLAGGIIPPVLLPQLAARLGELSPIAWMRALAAEGMGVPAEGAPGAALTAVSAGLLLPAGLLYLRRCAGKEEP